MPFFVFGVVWASGLLADKEPPDKPEQMRQIFDSGRF